MDINAIREENKNNKENVPWEHYKAVFATIDPKEVQKRCNVSYKEETCEFHIYLMGIWYGVRFPDFEIRLLEEREGFAALRDTIPAKILVARFLIEGKYFEGNHTFKTYRDMPWGEVYYRNFDGRCIKRLAFGFGFKLQTFSTLMEMIGAKKIESGDVGYEFEFLNQLHMQFIVWAGDEEFPPSSQILFEDNFPFAFSAEDMAVVGDVSIGTLKQMEKEQEK